MSSDAYKGKSLSLGGDFQPVRNDEMKSAVPVVHKKHVKQKVKTEIIAALGTVDDMHPKKGKKKPKRKKQTPRRFILSGGGAAAAENLNPPVTDGLAAHFLASQVGVADGAQVASWTDRITGLIMTQPVAAKPTYRASQAGIGNKPAVEFVDNQYMGADSGPLTDPNAVKVRALQTVTTTVFWVGRFRTGAQRGICLGKGQNSAASGWNIEIGVGGVGGLAALVGNGAGSFAYCPTTGTVLAPLNQWGVMEFLHTAADNNRVFFNGTQAGDNRSMNLGYSGTTDKLIGGLCFGGFYWDEHPTAPGDGLTSTADIDIAEVLIYTRDLSDSERSQVRAFLGNKYGLTVV